jgi:hypothetical protein
MAKEKTFTELAKDRYEELMVSREKKQAEIADIDKELNPIKQRLDQ